MRRRLKLRLSFVAVFFTLTGLSALLIEQVFEKLLSTVVGASTPAATIVLAVYFLGLTLGGASYPLVAPRVSRPLLLYGALEGFVGIWVILLALFMPQIQMLSVVLIQQAGESLMSTFLARMVVAGLWILPITIAMGMSFPAVVGALGQFRAPRMSALIARLYALNVLGAMLGAAAGPYLFFPAAGLAGTLLLTAAVQVGVVCGVWWISRGLPPRRQVSAPSTRARPDRWRMWRRALQSNGAFYLLTISFVSGFLFFGFEVLWTHLIGSVIGTSVYAFAIMLTMVLAGLFLGGTVSSVLISRGRLPMWTIPLVMVASCGALSWTFALWDDASEVFIRLGANATSFLDGELIRLGVAAILVGCPAAVLGLLYPSLFRVPAFPTSIADTMSGILAAVNAVGSIVGALVTGFLLLPVLGSEGVYRLYVLGLAMVAVLLSFKEFRRQADQSRANRLVAGTLIFLALGVGALGARLEPWNPLRLTSGANVYFRRLFEEAETGLLFWHEDLYGGFTTVTEASELDGAVRSRTLRTNGKFEGNDTGEMIAQVSFTLIPLLHQPRRDRALVIGLGTGHSTGLAAAAGFRDVDVAEIAPGIVMAAREMFSHINHEALDRANVHLALEDGRNLLVRSRGVYDLISIELTSVWFAGASNLYSREFYQLAKQHLGQDGVLQQWIQLHHIRPREVVSAVATMREVFDHVTVWFLGGQGILIASESPLEISEASIVDLETREDLQSSLLHVKRVTGMSLRDLPSFRLLEETETTRLAEFARQQRIPLNTDRNRFLEFSTPRHNLERIDHVTIVVRALLGFVEPQQRQSRLEAVLAPPP